MNKLYEMFIKEIVRSYKMNKENDVNKRNVERSYMK